MAYYTKKWVPIFDLDSIGKKLNEIADVLSNNALDGRYSLLTGNTGVALFFYYYGLFKKEQKYFDTGNSIVLNNIALINNSGNKHYSLCNGTSGFLWGLDHMIKQDFIKGECNEIFSSKDSELYTIMLKDMNEKKFDFLHNALGIGLYLLDRNNPYTTSCIESTITVMEQIAEKDISGIKWRSTVNFTNESKEVYNLSLSHGVASIISFLGKTYKYDIAKDSVKKLLMSAIAFLLSSRSNSMVNDVESIFPSYIYMNGEKSNKSRLAWCYGDLGIGNVLWQISQILKNPEWERIAIDVLIHSTKRRDPVMEMVRDACICHGSSGIAHIYNRMYQSTGIENFKESAIYWLNDTMNKSIFKDGIAGFKTWHSQEYGGWTNEIGILDGVAGIGLVLLAAISDIEPKWDECLLLS